MNDQSILSDPYAELANLLPKDDQKTMTIPQAKAFYLRSQVLAHPCSDAALIAAAAPLISMVSRTKLNQDHGSLQQDQWQHELLTFEQQLLRQSVPQTIIMAAKTILTTWLEDTLLREKTRSKEQMHGQTTLRVIEHCLTQPQSLFANNLVAPAASSRP